MTHSELVVWNSCWVGTNGRQTMTVVWNKMAL